MAENWIKLHSIAIERGWLKNQNLWTFWTYCLMKATRKPHIAKVGFQEVPLEPGQFIFGTYQAREDTELTVQNIRTCIDKLKKSKNITVKTTNKYSVITIENWEFYQSGIGQTNSQTNKPLTNQKQTSNKPVTTYKSIESDKRKRVIYSEQFERFWNAHPRRAGSKKLCFTEWNKKMLDDKIDDVMLALENHIVSESWTKEDCKWITGTQKWIENGMWTVKLPPKKPGRIHQPFEGEL